MIYRVSLKAARVNVGMTQDQAGAALGVSKSTIINWEHGETSPDYNMMQKICSVYNVPMDNLILPS